MIAMYPMGEAGDSSPGMATMSMPTADPIPTISVPVTNIMPNMPAAPVAASAVAAVPALVLVLAPVAVVPAAAKRIPTAKINRKAHSLIRSFAFSVV